MNILLVNDDGIDALGLSVLSEAVRNVFPRARITVYAPSQSISGAGRSLTFGDGKMVQVEMETDNDFRVYGTPCDCVDIACRLQKFDLCISGVNHGFNLGNDLYLSGTAQAAHYCWDYFNIPSIAFSTDKAMLDNPLKLQIIVEKVLVKLLDPYCKLPASMGELFNPNVITPLMGDAGRAGFVNVNIPLTENEEVQMFPTKLGAYKAVGKLTVAREEDGSVWYDLLEPMSQLEKSKENHTDVGAVESGTVSVTRIV